MTSAKFLLRSFFNLGLDMEPQYSFGATTRKVIFGTLSSCSRRSFANHFNIFRYNVAHFSAKNRNIFSSQVAFSVVAFRAKQLWSFSECPFQTLAPLKRKTRGKKGKKKEKIHAFAPLRRQYFSKCSSILGAC